MESPIARRGKSDISPRKAPRQARSNQLVADVLEAAARVLGQQGARGFTTARVAEAAGVSVGSLYQYFPNKQAILFRLQTEEWSRTAQLLQGILQDHSRAAMVRLRDTVVAFFLSEWDESSLRVALGDAAPAFRDAPETRAQRLSGERQLMRFMSELLPAVPPRQRRFSAQLMLGVMEAVGARISERARSRAQVEAWAHGIADMLGAYLGARPHQSGDGQ